jgi:intracellular sulfur oxidation DsrE/DsrF family protein
MLKVLFHIDEMEKWTLLIGNIVNFIKDFDKDNYSITVVVNGESVSGLTESIIVNKLKSFPKNVTFEVCRNSLNHKHIEESILPDFVKVVKSGVVEIALLEEEGYHYIKP